MTMSGNCRSAMNIFAEGAKKKQKEVEPFTLEGGTRAVVFVGDRRLEASPFGQTPPKEQTRGIEVGWKEEDDHKKWRGRGARLTP